MKNLFSKKPTFILFLLLIIGLTYSSYGQEYTPFTRTYDSGENYRYQNNIKGDLIFIANNILNRDGGTTTTEPEDPYDNQAVIITRGRTPSDYNDDETGGANNYNDSKDMQYIDVDNDLSTFSSSSATLDFPEIDCNQIRYAALYWSATYPSELASDAVGTNRQTDFNQVKLKVPGGSYVDITADEILYDGFTAADNDNKTNSPYACYADVTSQLTALDDPTGEYTIANVRAALGDLSGGAAAGWTIVIVYENPTLSGKLITTYDGFARVNSTNPNVDINYSGFLTIPSGQVNANLGAAVLEGDYNISGDQLQIREKNSDPFVTVNNGANPTNNFFNSNISYNGTVTTGRTPNSINTLGYDTDIFLLNNTANSIIDNDATEATFRFTSSGDQYYPFFNSFNIEIIEPEIVLEKKVTDLAETEDLTGAGVNLGDNLKYILSFENIGNDDATNYTIKDILPLNVTLNEASLAVDGNLPDGVTYTFDEATRTIIFTIPDEYITEGAPVESIRMEVKVAENCFDFIDACSDQIENVAYSTYQGVENDNVITEDPSVTDFDSCGFVTPGATNFLLDDLSDCDFSREVLLCGDDVLLEAGENFDDYIWYLDVNENGLIDLGTDTVLDDGNSDNDLSTFLVDQTGTYIVDKIVADPCKGFQEIITVKLFGTTQTSPIIDYFNDQNSDSDLTNDIQGEILRCSIDGESTVEIFLCGSNDTELLEVNIPDADSIEWQKLDEASCSSTDAACPNKSNSCYSTIQTGNAYTLTGSGKYRLVINYEDGCSSRFYFSAFKNDLEIITSQNDIFCDTDGNITVTNLGSGYGFQLYNLDTDSAEVPFSAGQGPSFDIANAGNYQIDIRQLDSNGDPIENSCEFSSDEIGIRDREFQVDIETTEANCNEGGSINIQVLNVRANYTYDLRFDDGTTNSYGTGTRVNIVTAETSNDHTFYNLNADDYIVVVTTQDGCESTQNITVGEVDDIKLTAAVLSHIGCTAGTIELTATGGFPDPEYSYAIWSKDGTDFYTSIDDIPASAYTADPIFEFGYRDTDFDDVDEYYAGEDGIYEFVVVDANNCFIASNSVTLEDNGTMTISIDATASTPITCNSSSDASIVINTSNGVAPYEYSIDNGASYQDNNTFLNLEPDTYYISVLDSSGCSETLEYTIDEPETLSASAGVSRDVTCDPAGAEVRFTNVIGGQSPYTYSFDGGSTFGTSSTAILPPGNYNTLVVKDALGCEFAIDVFVEDFPVEPTITTDVDYNCDGTGNITVNSDIDTYDYTYELDGVLNSPDESSNIFSNIAPGTYNITTNYSSQTPPTPSQLLVEDFGSGTTTSSNNTIGYTYEDQTTDAPGDSDRNINDFEYSVTNSIVAPFGTWLNPDDHTSNGTDTNGRYLVINVGTPSPGQVIYSKEINDVIPNQDINISLFIFNLVNSSSTILDPDLTIEIATTTGTVVQSIRTGDIPKTEQWESFSVDLNPGNNTELEFIIRSEKVGNNGNDFALDDIEIYQIPEVCPLSVETTVIVEEDQEFRTNFISSTNVTCNGDTDGTITFEVFNFDPATGFEYSNDNWVTSYTSTISPVTTPAILGAGTQTIDIRRVNEQTCISQIIRDITEPTAVLASASITTEFTCDNTGATITASATGGLPTYEYQLEDTLGNIIGSYDFASNGTNTTFIDLPTGDYIVIARDSSNCEDPIDLPITVEDPEAITFTASPSSCYAGASDAEILVTVTGGNGGLLFSINNGAYEAPNPTTASTYTFDNLASGDYIINVKDQFGCEAGPQTITINPSLSVTANASAITSCATTTDVTFTTTGGDGNYVYAIVTDGTTVTDSDFSTTNPVAISITGDYDVYVRDAAGVSDYCEATNTITITKNDPLVITETVTDVTCFGDTNGTISVDITGGNVPYSYSIDGGTLDTNATFSNLSAGDYDILVQDADGCTETKTITVSEPNEIVAEAIQTRDYTCLPSGEAEITVGSVTATTGGSGNYQYNINGGSWTTSTTGGTIFTGLTDGTYTIQVRDANATSCVTTLTDVIIDPLPTVPTLEDTITYNCDGTGNITITPFDASYTYAIDGGTPQTGTDANIFNDIATGTHTIEVNYGSECTTSITVNVEAGKEFTASITNPINVTCFGDSNGGFTINASNFGSNGYEYSLDGTNFFGPFTTSETVTGLTAQNYSITVRDIDNPTICAVILTEDITEPTELIASAIKTTEFTCSNTGATITASASGGTPTYEYQLEDASGNIIGTYDFISNGDNTVFTNLTAGDYIVVARDSNNCEDPIDAPITVDVPQVPTFTATPTACYSGENDGTIQVDVTSIPGNGNFQFSINGNPWITPNTSTATTYTFTGLASGSYTIDVKDGFGCEAVQETVVINSTINATIDVTHVSSCDDGNITVNATGGDGNLMYAFVTTGTTVTSIDFISSNSYTVDALNSGDYDVYVWDNNAIDPHCEYTDTVTVDPATTLTYTAIPTDPECYDGTGTIDINVSSGIAPYTYEIIDLDNGGASDETATNVINNTKTFFNLSPGNYTINVTDASGCTIQTTPVTINNPDELVTDIESNLTDDCDPATGFTFINYTTTLNGTLEFSHDGGATWQTSDVFDAPAYTLTSGDAVDPSIRTVDASGNTLCRLDLPRYIIKYPLDNLDITIAAIIVNCNELQVSVQGNEGTAPYQYTYTDDPVNFDATTPSNPWTTPAKGLSDPHTFTGLVPGRTYVFFVRDANGCIRQSDINVNDLITLPLEITSTSIPACFGMTNGSITYTITDNEAPFGTEYRYEVYNMSTGTPVSVTNSGGNVAFSSPQSVTVSGLGEGEYFIEVTERDSGVDSCVSASENLLLEELEEITADLNKIEDISCATPGLIEIQNINGGGGNYSYTVAGPLPFLTITGTTDNPIEIPANSPAGSYNVTIQDQYSCSKDLGDVIMTLTPNPTIDSIEINNCANPNSLTINATSTATEILYSIDGGVTYLDNGGLFTNLTDGTYTVSIKDSNGCTATDTAIIHPVLEANVQLTKLMDCTPGTAEITIEAINGSGNYDYEITNTLGTVVSRTALTTNPFVASVTVVETYTVTVYDNDTTGPECSRVFTIDVEDAVEPIIDTTNSTPITCIGDDDGTITVTALDNGTGPYTFEITSLDGTATSIAPTTTTNTSATFTNLAPTTTTDGYIVTVTADATNNCSTDSSSIIINEPTAISISIDPLVDVVQFTCIPDTNTDNNASITVNTVSGGSGTFTRYVFENTTTSTIVQDGTNIEYIETDRNGGNYTISVYDDNGCIGTATATIDAFDELLTIDSSITSAITCTPGNDGEVTISVTSTNNDTTKFEYSNDNGASWQTSNIFPNLGVGTHNFLVRHIDTNCELFTSINITDPNTFTVDTPVTTDVICKGSATGTATFNVNDVTYTGTYSWEVFNSDSTTTSIIGTSADFTATGLIAGEYYVTFTQDGVPTCDNQEPFSIAEPENALAAGTSIVTDITCNPTDNGTIEIVNVTGGWGDYSYYVSTTPNPDSNDASNYVATPKFENLVAGTYEIWVIDSRGCALRLTDITLVNPTPITADLQLNNENCTNFKGELQVINQTGGQGANYSYQLQRFDGSNFVDLRAIQTNDTFSDLGEGQYQVVITDQWGCTGTTTNTIDLYEEIVPLATTVKTIDCTATPGGEITISQTGGSGTYSYTGTDPSGNPLTPNTDGIFTNLTLDGEYSFTITDGTCSFSINKTLAPAVLLPTPTIDAFTNVTCFGDNNGTIAVSVTDNGIDPYTFEITDKDGTTVNIAPTSATNTSAVFENLENTTGTGYVITVTGSNDCTNTITQTISQPTSALTVATPTVTQYNCTTANTTNYATIDVTGLATGGSGNYVRYVFENTTTSTVVQDGANTTYTETNLSGGNYTITVYDDMGCTNFTTTTIDPFVAISDPTVSIVNTVTCNADDEDIIVGITINPVTATPNLTYTVTSTNGYNQTFNSSINSQAFTGLGIGNYIVTVTNNDTGCFVTTIHEVKDPKEIEVTATKITDEECLNDGIDAGSFNVTIDGYTGGYNYQLYSADGTAIGTLQTGNTNTPLIIDNLEGGGYYVEITETDTTSTFCTDASNVVIINAPEFEITATVSEQSNVTCDNNKGSILVDPTGGEAPYTITITSATFTQTEADVSAYLFQDLSAGDYNVTITDALGCMNTDYSIELIEPTPITATISADIQLECYGDNTGFVTATVTSGGLGTLKYQLNTYDASGTTIITTSVAQSSDTFTGLFSGKYSITVSDDVSCFGETPIATISDPVDVFGSLTLTQDISCVNDVELLLTANGGTAPYSYSIDGTNFFAFNNGNEHEFNSLPSGNSGAGTYRYYVQDSFNCISTLSNEIVVDEVPPITYDIDTSAATINCNGDNTAIISIRAAGGLGNYEYELLDSATSTTPLETNTNGTFNNLSAGEYYIRIISEDCEEITTVIEIIEPTPLAYTDDYSAVICAGDDNGYITVSLSGGSGNYQYAISPNLAQFDDENSFTDLEPGIYTVIAQDMNGCFIQTEYIIEASTEINIDAITTGETCLGEEDGIVDLEITGGVAPYSTRLENTSYVLDQVTYSGFASGIHTIYVIDDLGCETEIEITIDSGVNIKATVTPIYECTGDTPNNSLNVVLEDASVDGMVIYQLDDENSSDARLEPNFTNIAPGEHTLITSLNGCVELIPFTIEDFETLTLELQNNNINEITAIADGGKEEYIYYFNGVSNGNDNTIYINRSGTYTVTVVDENGCEAISSIEMEFIDIEIPNFFTPDGDGNNEFWTPENTEGFPNILTIIFDRYGRELYRMGENDKGWNGIYQNSELPTGDYWYVIKLRGESDEREFVGNFTLYR
ncbi:T9SS type B sorting domain-containing protein [Cellulophaga baltica]|nr:MULTISPECIES: T9SS type B sorting domain-containing protein [Cellulophaga]MBU2995899.1 T9SS type B sorting domain-containing protein [Cellulophaga baltica]MDO6767294.1 T9SS type B sorting domain-containing protein [Cellulophaga sp. 1_MG-2023]